MDAPTFEHGEATTAGIRDSQILRRLLTYMKPHWRTLIVAFTVLLLATSSNVVGPIIIKVFIDRYLTHGVFPRGPVALLGGSYLALQIAAGLLNYAQLLMFQTIALKVIQQLRVDLFSHLQYLSLSFFDRTPVGSLVSRMTNDTEAIKDLYMSVLSAFVQNGFLLGGIFISMFVLDVRLATFCLFLLPVIYGLMTVYRKISGPVFLLARQKLSDLNAKLSESLQGMHLIQALRQQKRLQEQFDEINNQYRAARLRNVNLNGLLLRPLVDGISLLTLILILSFFGLQSLHAVVDIGVLYAFVNYLDQFFEPVNQMMMQMNLFQQAVAAARRVFHLMDETDFAPRHLESSTNAVTEGRISFEGVSFSYDGKTEVLHDITFVAEPGQTVALVGHTGSGKSSIVNLLLHFYLPDKGRITVDGKSLRELELENFRRQVGLVLQEPFIFAGDIASNIRLRRPDLCDGEIVAAARFVQAEPFILRLPEGYEEKLGQRGSRLSGGQKQLVAFARTMANDPKILVLDEATASIDTETEQEIQTALGRMRSGRTTIAIAHRLSTIQDADLILVLHHGRIVERGTHQQLLALQGLYHKMYLLQQGSETDTRIPTSID